MTTNSDVIDDRTIPWVGGTDTVGSPLTRPVSAGHSHTGCNIYKPGHVLLQRHRSSGLVGLL